VSGPRPPRWARALVERWVTGAHREFVLGDLEETFARHRAVDRTSALWTYLMLGLLSGLRDRTREVLSGLAADTRHALTRIGAHPRFHLGASGVLALGLGMITAAWGVEYGAYARGLPVRAPERMVAVTGVDTDRAERVSSFSVADMEVLRAQAQGLEQFGLWGTELITLDEAERAPEQVFALRATPGLFDLLEIEPAFGRALTPADTELGAVPVTVLGHRLWTRRFAGERDVLGRTVRIDGVPTTVVGVLPPGPTFQGEELWLPVTTGGEARRERAWSVLARAAPGTTVGVADAALSGLGTRLDETSTVRLRLVPFAESFREPGGVASRYLYVVNRSGWLLCFMALANVANLFLIRTRQRTRELAVRRALGATRLRVLRQVLLEVGVTVGLALVGGALLASQLLAWYQGRMDAYYSMPISWQLWTFSPAHLKPLSAAGGAAFLVVSVIVATASLQGDTGASLREGRGTTTRFRLAQGLVAVEIAGGGALFLLAALMITSAWNLRANDWGFAVESVMTGHVALPDTDTRSDADRLRLWGELEAELERLPGVEAATLGTQLPVIRYAGRWQARRAVDVTEDGGSRASELPRHYVASVAPSYFETFHAPIMSGRGFTSADIADSEPVALVNTAFAEVFFPEGDVLGRRLRIWEDGDPGPWRTVVGVAPHLWMDADENRDPEGVYVPLAQSFPAELSVAVRVRGGPASVGDDLRRVVSGLLPGVPLTDVRTMRELIRYRTRLYRRDGPLFIWLGVAALVLAVLGLYMVISYIATIRTREFGIRAALGASSPNLVARATLWGFPSLAVGIPGGIATGLWLTRGFARYMFQVDPWSPGVAVIGFGVLTLVAIGASMIPALRAGRVDLLRVLKVE